MARPCGGCGLRKRALTRLLAEHFAQVVGLDPSADQLANAPAHPRVRYRRAPAGALPLADGAASLLTAAQAAHWFDLPAFRAEARRVGPGAVVALVSYGVLRLDDPRLNDRFARFRAGQIGPFWPPERRLVDEGYAGITFPFDQLPGPELRIAR